MRSFLFEHAGLRFAVWEEGAGAPFVFQHGLCGDARQTMDLFPPDTGMRCITLECRGHGGSEAGSPAEFSHAVFAADVAALIESVASGPVVLGGISLGAALALRLAVLRPEIVRALVLARPAWAFEPAPATMEPNAFVGELLRRFPAAIAGARFEESEIAHRLAIEAPDNLASLRGFFDREPSVLTAELLSRLAAGGPGVERVAVGALHIPTLVIGHERDYIHPLEMARTLAESIPQASLVEITPKAESRDRYRTDFLSALTAFMREC